MLGSTIQVTPTPRYTPHPCVTIVQEFSASSAEVGWTVGIFFATGFLAAIFGALEKTYGCGVVAKLGGILIFCGRFLSTFAPNVPFLWVSHGVLTGIGVSMTSFATTVLVQQRFSQNRVLAGGMAMLGLTLGHIIAPIAAERLIAEYGWRGATAIESAIYGHVLVLSLTFPHSKPRTNIVEPLERDANKPYLVKRIRKHVRRLCDLSILRIVPLLLMCIASIAAQLNVIVFISHLPNRAIHVGLTEAQAALLTSLVGIASLICRILTMFVANTDRINIVIYFTVGMSLGGLASVLMTACYTFSEMAVAALLQGANIGFTNTIIAVVLVDLVGVDKLPRAVSVFFMSTAVSTSVGTPFAGWLFDLTGDYRVPYLAMGILALCAVVPMSAAAIIDFRARRTASSIYRTRPPTDSPDMEDTNPDIAQ